jgi:fluoroacetyl-CoA thioesterase
MDGRKLTFSIEAHDGTDKITQGTHERVVIDSARFTQKVSEKAQRANR